MEVIPPIAFGEEGKMGRAPGHPLESASRFPTGQHDTVSIDLKAIGTFLIPRHPIHGALLDPGCILCVPCFTPGTQIATDKGERPVEDIRPGARIVTRDNGLQEVRWAGIKRFDWLDLRKNPHLRPVLIRAGALGDNGPEKDMLVSPNHRMLVTNDRTSLHFEEHEVLVAAKHLIDNRGVSEVEALGVTYHHFLFDGHEAVLANGCWSESFQPGDFSLGAIGNAQRSEILELFPDLKSPEGIEAFTDVRPTVTTWNVHRLSR